MTAALRSTSDCDNASPAMKICASVTQPRASGCWMKALSIDGTKCAAVTPCSTISSASRTGSLWASGSAMATLAPASSGQNNSYIETSKVSGVLCSITSPGPSRYWACIHSTQFRTFRWLSCTPFGVPVEPEV